MSKNNNIALIYYLGENKPNFENNEVQEASIDALRQSSLDGILVEHEDGSQNYMTFQETQDVLEIHKRLNNTNRDKFEKTFASSEDAATQMINFFQGIFEYKI